MASPVTGASRASPGLVNTNTTAGIKRKRTTERKFYAVRHGKTPGIYESWSECLNQVRGHKGAVFKAFQSLHEAQAFVEGRPLATSTVPPGEQKFYAVQNGRVPGVYTDWTQAQAQIRGIRMPKHRKFNTRAEAEAFVAAGRKPGGPNATQLMVQNSAPGLQVNGTYAPIDKDGVPYEIGRRPLPSGAEDGYDPNVKLAPDGTIVDRTEEEKHRTKTVIRERDPPGMLRIYTDGSSLKNGQAGARAGVGVFFGPQDPKYANSPPSKPRPKKSRSKSACYASSSNPHVVYTMDWAARGCGPDAQVQRNKGKKWRRGGGEDKEQVSTAAAAEAEAEEDEKEKLTNWRYRNVSEALKGNKQTNQRAELTAILRALDIAPLHREVTIYTDSKYAIDCVTNWYRNWRKNGWVNSKGKPVENKDLVMDVREKIEERDSLGKGTFFVWVKGHAENAGNIAADKLAVQGAMLGRGLQNEGDQGGSSLEGAHGDLKRSRKTSSATNEQDEEAAAFEAMEQAMAGLDDEEEEFP